MLLVSSVLRDASADKGYCLRGGWWCRQMEVLWLASTWRCTICKIQVFYTPQDADDARCLPVTQQKTDHFLWTGRMLASDWFWSNLPSCMKALSYHQLSLKYNPYQGEDIFQFLWCYHQIVKGLNVQNIACWVSHCCNDTIFLSVFRRRKTWRGAHTSDNVVLHRIHDRKRGQHRRLEKGSPQLNVGSENEPVKWN